MRGCFNSYILIDKVIQEKIKLCVEVCGSKNALSHELGFTAGRNITKMLNGDIMRIHKERVQKLESLLYGGD